MTHEYMSHAFLETHNCCVPTSFQPDCCVMMAVSPCCCQLLLTVRPVVLAGAGGSSLDDMIMHSIGAPGAGAAADALMMHPGTPIIPTHNRCVVMTDMFAWVLSIVLHTSGTALLHPVWVRPRHNLSCCSVSDLEEFRCTCRVATSFCCSVAFLSVEICLSPLQWWCFES